MYFKVFFSKCIIYVSVSHHKISSLAKSLIPSDFSQGVQILNSFFVITYISAFTIICLIPTEIWNLVTHNQGSGFHGNPNTSHIHYP